MGETYSLAVGYGELSEMARYLIRSIRLIDERANIVAFIAEEEEEEIPPNVIEEITEKAEVVRGNTPIAGYPMSCKIKASIEAEKMYGGRIVQLDSDMLLLDEIDLSRHHEIYMKPADKGKNFDYDCYGKIEGFDSNEIYHGTVDRKKMPPFFNAGFVFMNDSSFPEEWLKTTRSIYERTSKFFSDQMALGMLSSEYDISTVSEEYNYPLPHRMSCPRNVKIVHYHRYPLLYRLSGELRKRATKIGIFKEMKRPVNLAKSVGYHIKTWKEGLNEYIYG